MNAVESLNSKMFDVIKKCIGKQVILYGYGKSGIFIEWLCSHVYGKKFTLVIDDKKVIPGINLHRKIILDYVDPKETVILMRCLGAGFNRNPAASGVRAAWCFGNLNNGGNGSVSCRNSNNWVSNANWNGSLGATGTIMGLVFKNHCTV